MTTYRKISEAEVAVGAPLTQQLFHALKDNMLAYREGDASIPNPPSYKAFFSSAEPDPGNIIIAQSVGHFNEPIGAGVSVNIRRDGDYRVRMTFRNGQNTHGNSDDGNTNPSQAQANFRRLRAGEVHDYHTAIISQSQMSTNYFDISLQEDDIIYVDISENNPSIEVSIILTVAVADTNALWGIEAIGRLG
jgi:hypothetical protein|tara:strand:+ start:441 stop:1013 length:573 start_codon:yes stop_codon:yes gene_type:complete